MKRSSPNRSVGTFLAATGSTWRDASRNSVTNGHGYREKSLVLTSALHEYRRLRGAGTAVSIGEFCDRFPNYRKSLLRLIDVEENLGDLGKIEDPFPEVGGEFLGFEILDELGMGAIARVYLAAEPELGGRCVVIKVSADGTAEAATLGKLQHPNIVQVHSVKRDPESSMTAVCMPYQGSATLTDVLDLVFQEGQPPQSGEAILDVANRLADLEALRDDDLATSRPDPVLVRGSFVDAVVHLGLQLAAALEYAHNLGVLHRDLKPSNILLTPLGRPMLLDFNLSFDAEHDTKPRGGTLPYMAPEQIRGSIRGAEDDDIDPRVDIFSLGAILYELLTGKLPFGGPPEHLGPEAASLWQLNAHTIPLTPIRTLNPEVPAAIAEAIERCLAIDPEVRTGTLAELTQALGKHFSVALRVKRFVARNKKWTRAAILLIVISCFATAAFFALRPKLHERQYKMALEAYVAMDHPRALTLVAESLRAEPECVRAWELQYLCHVALKNTDEALQDLERLVKIAPSSSIWESIGCAYYRKFRIVDAANCFEKAIALKPNDPKHHAQAAMAWSKVDNERAEEYATNAISIDPSFVPSYFVRADIRLRTKNQQAAKGDLDEAIRQSPNSKWVLFSTIEMLSPFIKMFKGLESEIPTRLQKAVELGLTKKIILQSIIYKKFKSEPWFAEVIDSAKDIDETREDPLSALMVPSSPIGL